MKTLLAVLGDPIEHSLSPQIHSQFLAQAKLEGSYLRIQTKALELADTLKRLGSEGYLGVNLTIPLKEIALALCQHKSPEVEALGACNSISFLADGSLKADNTDWLGFLSSLPVRLKQNLGKAAVLGAGGSAKAIIYALCALRPREIVIISRSEPSTSDNLAALLTRIEAQGIKASFNVMGSAEEGLAGAQLIVNTTPLGMHGHSAEKSPLLAHELDALTGHLSYFYDLVYSPAETVFLREARSRGFQGQNGLAMLVGQAGHAFCLWTGFRFEDLDLLGSSVLSEAS